MANWGDYEPPLYYPRPIDKGEIAAGVVAALVILAICIVAYFTTNS